jgi:hypothetical protein
MSSPDDDKSAWTPRHHLVGKPVARSLLCPVDSAGSNAAQQHYGHRSVCASVIAFQEQDSTKRKPALWRALIRSENHPVYAVDSVASDWQVPPAMVIPTETATAAARERLENLLYQAVLVDWLPAAVLTAAVEEVQAQFLQQQLLVQSSQQQEPSSSRPTMASLSFHYYTKPPSAYLWQPTATTKAETTVGVLPVQFTPAALVQRIKQGCAAAWQDHCSRHPPPTQLAEMRRSSTRVARLQVLPDDNSIPDRWKVVPGGKVAVMLRQRVQKSRRDELVSDTYGGTTEADISETDEKGTTKDGNGCAHGRATESKLKVAASENGSANPVNAFDEAGVFEDEDASQPDGNSDEEYAPVDDGDDDDEDDKDIGIYVRENVGILSVEMNEKPAKEEEEVVDQEREAEGGDGEVNEGDADIVSNNPYLPVEGSAVLEWLGRKTSKLLSSSDIQAIFPALLPPKTKGKKQVLTAGQISIFGGDALELLSSTDQVIWRRMLPHGKELVGPGARILFQLVNGDEDVSKILQWEAPSFARSLFTVRIWNVAAEQELSQQAYDEYAVADMDYKEKKAWGTWRYKGINSGYTVWPSWLEAFDSWRKSQFPAILSSEPDASDRMEEEADDLALARALVEQDLSVGTGTRKSRRSAEGGGAGVFYGNQTSMTQKQLMDGILRLVSQKSYHTIMSLVSVVPDDSSDPLRRIRGALGKLVFKRNQLVRMTVQPRLSDLSVWDTLSKTPLTTISHEKCQHLAIAPSSEQKGALVEYIAKLHKTELRLRQMVLEHLAGVPIGIMATSADERPGSMESMDETYFDVAGGIVWHTSGHEWLNRIIYRPPSTSHSDHMEPCMWFTVRDFSEPVASTPEDGDSGLERPQIGLAKDAMVVERRRRFRASANHTSGGGDAKILLLTEAQVQAGLAAAELEKKRVSSLIGTKENPFAGSMFSQIALIPPDGSTASPLSVLIVGHDSIVDASSVVHQRILVLPGEVSSSKDALWATLAFPDNGTIECQLEGDPVIYALQQNEYHSSSPAFQECRNIVSFTLRHAKAGPFIDPVDPVALGIPDYPNVVKHPMDLSTLSSNLESGKYSNIPPKQSKGRTAVARMLKGPFGRDMDLIFDNAMLFNPPNDWIHQSASTLKKVVWRKIDQAISSAESKSYGRSKQSIYLDEDSDVDLYEYESDPDDDYRSSGKSRKRKPSDNRSPIKEDSSTRSIERPTRLDKVLCESGLRGPFVNMPISTEASSFSLPQGWCCRRRCPDGVSVPPAQSVFDTELGELISLHRAIEETDINGLRRSTRTYNEEPRTDISSSSGDPKGQVDYINIFGGSMAGEAEAADDALPQSRAQVEFASEMMHEEVFAKLYQNMYKAIDSETPSYGSFTEGSFPPYLGHVVPVAKAYDQTTSEDSQSRPVSRWEIRAVYLLPALRWVIRGLIGSGHLSEPESTEAATDTGVIIPNHVYYLDPEAEAFDVVDVRELTRRKKRANDAAAVASSDDEVELSAYEQMRADRVARNAERLKALGLA